MIHVTSASTNGINSTLLWIPSAYSLKAQSPLAHHSRSCKGYSHVWSTWVPTAANCPSWKSWIIQQPQAAGAPEPPVVACILQKISHRNGAVNPIRHLDTRWHKTTNRCRQRGFFLTSWAGIHLGGRRFLYAWYQIILRKVWLPSRWFSLVIIIFLLTGEVHIASKMTPTSLTKTFRKETINWPLDVVKIQKKYDLEDLVFYFFSVHFFSKEDTCLATCCVIFH